MTRERFVKHGDSEECLKEKLSVDRYEESFLHTLNDLREKVGSYDRYQLVKASGLLRLLLLDPLIHEANRKHKIKFKFYLTLRNHRRAEIKSLTLAEFLATEWQSYRKHTYSVKEIIDASAHFFGGVHVKKPKLQKEIDLIDIFNYRPITIDTIKRSLRGISQLTIEALEELEKKIKKVNIWMNEDKAAPKNHTNASAAHANTHPKHCHPCG